MKPQDCLAIALRSLSRNKLRSSLTMLGILIGIAAVISMVSLVRAQQTQVESSFQSLGSNLIMVSPGSQGAGHGMGGILASSSTLTLEDAEAIEKNAPSVAAVAPVTQSSTQIVAGGENVGALTLGVTPLYQYVRNYSTNEGRFITEQDHKAAARVAVLGSELDETLFGDTPAIGQSIRINKRQFKVVGVLESKGETFGTEDQGAMVPLSTAQAVLSSQRVAGGEHTIQAMAVQAESQDKVDAAQWEIQQILRERHHLRPDEKDDFSVIDMGDISRVADEIYVIFEIVLGAIAGISLLVGGIGIMNIMLVSVTERTREIGLRKAVGAKRRHILTQFLSESALLSLCGGAMGILLGWIMVEIAAAIVASLGYPLPALLPLDVVLLAVGVSIGVGLASGMYPATRAARLNPIEALRHE